MAVNSKVGVIEGSVIMVEMGGRDVEYLIRSIMRRCPRESMECPMASHYVKNESFSSFLFPYYEDRQILEHDMMGWDRSVIS